MSNLLTMWPSRFLVTAVFISLATPVNACDVTIGDWKLARGDVKNAEMVYATSSQSNLKPNVSIVLSVEASKHFADVTNHYASPVKDSRLPIMAGKIKKEPRVVEQILDGRFIIETTTQKQAEILAKKFRECI